MASVISKSLWQTAYATIIVFFSMVFLDAGGIRIFAQTFFSATAFVIFFLFLLFNIFLTIHWK